MRSFLYFFLDWVLQFSNVTFTTCFFGSEEVDPKKAAPETDRQENGKSSFLLMILRETQRSLTTYITANEKFNFLLAEIITIN
ncbi:hypothetical protein CH373_17505 [Leptospira perolatii]|uniref:Uncharacterized protein n=1 Tax=Leptospira perolatii TaxID=2023191 RepID=A0A2M9ZIE4_9LEPT|nr:hypothetical protein CH360_12350 [Leptospira perolatii]PJZ71781.1 hypothetical protein CH373_17505 [Leptospira perolatii]